MKLFITTGDRAVHISMNYDDAEVLAEALRTENESEGGRLLAAIQGARKAGKPLPPLKKGTVKQDESPSN